MRKRWTQIEEEILKKNYGKISNKELQKLLPNRTIDSLRGKAKLMGLLKSKDEHIETLQKETEKWEKLFKKEEEPAFMEGYNIGYIASIIVGVGWISLGIDRSLSNSLRAGVFIDNSDKMMIDFIYREIIPFAQFTKRVPKIENRKIQYRLSITNDFAIKLLLAKLSPFIIGKNEQAKLLLECIKLKENRTSNKISSDEWEIYRKMKELHK